MDTQTALVDASAQSGTAAVVQEPSTPSSRSRWRDLAPSADTNLQAETATGLAQELERAAGTLKVLHKWVGQVLTVSPDRTEFEARLRSASDFSAEMAATFSVEDVSPSDSHLIEPGAIFYFSVGYATSAAGERKRQSLVLFRRVRPVTAAERLEIDAKQDEYTRILRLLMA